MKTTDEKIAHLYEGLRKAQAQNWALKQLVLAMHAQGTDINNTMKHFMESCSDIDTHNNFSTLSEDFLTSFHESWTQLGQEMGHAIQCAPELRNRT